MDFDWSNDDMLGEEHELNESTRNFLGVKKGDPVNVRNAATIAASSSSGTLAPARLLQRPSARPVGNSVSAALATQPSAEGGSTVSTALVQPSAEGGLVKDGFLGRV
jgi:hypothetical protein